MSADLDLASRPPVVEGAGGRLFLSLADELYDRPWTDEAWLEAQWAEPLRRLSAAAREVGARFVTLVPPDAHGVHPAALPEGAAFARPSIGERFGERFETTTAVLHPLDALRGARGPVDPYRATDSHWSAAGAYVAYRELMARIEGTGARVLQPEDFTYAWEEAAGDLGAAVEPPRRVPTLRPVLRERRSRVMLDRFNHRRHALKVFEVDDPALPSAVVFRDSFATELAPFLAESFRRCVLVGAEALAFPELIADERPDVVILERGERTLPLGLHELGLLTWREHWPQPGDGPHEARAARCEQAAAHALDAGDACGAQTSAAEAFSLGPTADRRFLLGRAEQAAGRGEAAAASFAHALELAPGRWSLLMHLGIARLAAGRLPEARDMFARACAVAPGSPRGFEHFGYAALHLGEHDAARAALEHAVAIGPKITGSWTWLEQTLARLGDEEGTARVLARAAAAGVALG